MSDYPVPHSRVFKKFINVEDAIYEYAMKYRSSTNYHLPFSVKMSYMFHRSQMKCFELLVQHYWLCEIKSIPVSERKPVPMLVKVAFSWVVEDDKTFITDSSFLDLVDKLMRRRVASWSHLCINEPFPGCPDARLHRFLPVAPRVETSKSESEGSREHSQSRVES